MLRPSWPIKYITISYIALILADDDLVDHRVQGWEAIDNARELPLIEERTSQAGCKTCSSSDIAYCYSRSVMDDHCCCDRRHKERFPFIPHVCYKYLLPQCKPVAKDCDEYGRLYSCCCRQQLGEHYQNYAWSHSQPHGQKSNNFWIFTTCLLVISY